jgi:hypothetical protein
MTAMTQDQRTVAEKICQHANVWATAVPDVIEMYQNDSQGFEPKAFAEWIEGQRKPRAYLFVSEAGVDLEHSAFAERNVTARGRLLRELGPEAFEQRAMLWGLKGSNDFKTIGERPYADDNVKGGAGDRGKRDNSNPWSWPDSDQSRQAEIVRICRTNTALARNLSKAAGCRIDGRKL